MLYLSGFELYSRWVPLKHAVLHLGDIVKSRRASRRLSQHFKKLAMKLFRSAPTLKINETVRGNLRLSRPSNAFGDMY